MILHRRRRTKNVCKKTFYNKSIDNLMPVISTKFQYENAVRQYYWQPVTIGRCSRFFSSGLNRDGLVTFFGTHLLWSYFFSATRLISGQKICLRLNYNLSDFRVNYLI